MSVKVFSTDYSEGIKAYFRSDMVKLKRQITLTKNPAEKKLLKVRLLMEGSRLEEAQKLCASVVEYPLPFQGEKSFLLSTIYFQQRNYELSSRHGLEALDVFKELNDKNKQFKICHNLSVNFSELDWQEMSQYFLKRAEHLAQSVDDKLLILRAQACHFSKRGDYEKARQRLKSIDALLPERKDFEFDAYYLIAGDICAWGGDMPSAQGYFQRIKRRQNLLDRERLRTLQSFINAFLSGEKTKTLPRLPNFFTPDSEFTFQWKFLAAMQGGDLSKALSLWQKLRGLRPSVYGEDLTCLSENEKRSIFFQCVDKVRPVTQALPPASGLRGSLQRVYEIFLASPSPLRKEELIEKIWNVPYSVDYDNRFYKLMERLKSKVAARVVQRNRAYSLVAANH